MPLDGSASSRVDLQRHLASLLRNVVAFDHMNEGIANFLRIDNLPVASVNGECPGITQLPSHFGIKRRAIQHDRCPFFVLHHLEHFCSGHGLVKANELRAGIRRKAADADDLFLLSRAGAFPLLGHQFFKTNIIHLQPGFAGHQFRKIQWEAVSIIKFESKLAGKLLVTPQFLRLFLE